MKNRWIDVMIREGTFFSWEWGGGGGFGKFWYFFLKEVLALPCVLIKKTPDPPPLGDWQNCDPPLTTDTVCSMP